MTKFEQSLSALSTVEEYLSGKLDELPVNTELEGDDLVFYNLIAKSQKYSQYLHVALIEIEHPNIASDIAKFLRGDNV